MSREVDTGGKLADLTRNTMKKPAPTQKEATRRDIKKNSASALAEREKIAKAKKALYEYWKD